MVQGMTELPPDQPAEKSEHIGRYRLVSEIGRGAMGIVYLGEDEGLGRRVAIKTILASMDTAEQAGYLARFKQEAKALGGLNHPSIITVFEFGDEGGIAYLAMEYLEGKDLRELISARKLDLASAVDVAAQVADGLAFAHGRGVVHRDVKPGNVMVIEGNRAKVMDFGIARVRTSDLKTQTGLMLGSPRYMSPEQVLGRAVDHRSDIFSLGLVLYEMLTGAPPFGGNDIHQIMYQICNGRAPPPSASNPAVTRSLDLIVAAGAREGPRCALPGCERVGRGFASVPAGARGRGPGAGCHGGRGCFACRFDRGRDGCDAHCRHARPVAIRGGRRVEAAHRASRRRSPPHGALHGSTDARASIAFGRRLPIGCRADCGRHRSRVVHRDDLAQRNLLRVRVQPLLERLEFRIELAGFLHAAGRDEIVVEVAVELEHVAQVVRAGNPSARYAAGSIAWYTTFLPSAFESAAAMSAPDTWSPAMPTVLPMYSLPALKMPYAHAPMSAAEMPESLRSPMGMPMASVPSGPAFGPMPK
jgi:predicted Ser/Thr protein kinase